MAPFQTKRHNLDSRTLRKSLSQATMTREFPGNNNQQDCIEAWGKEARGREVSQVTPGAQHQKLLALQESMIARATAMGDNISQ